MKLPHADQAESALLGGAMLSKTAAAELADLVSVEDFGRDARKTVYRTIVELNEDGRPCDLPAVTEALARSGKLEEVGEAAGLDSLLVRGCSATQMAYYAGIVTDTARRRRVIVEARRLAEAASEGDEDLDGLIDQTVEGWTSGADSEGLLTFDDVSAALLERLSGGEALPSWPTGWSQVDQIFRLPQGLVTVVTGIPGSGKSTWVDCLTWNILKKHDDVRVAMFSPEQSPADQHAMNLMHTALGVDPMTADGQLVDRGLDWLDGRVVWLDEQRDNTVSGILSRARLAQRRYGVNLLVVDPWNKIRHDRSKHQRDDLYIQEALGRFTRFARKTGIAVVLVAHPKQQERESNSQTRIKPPTSYSISGGAEWDNQADVIVTVHRDQMGEVERSSLVQVIVRKVRHAGRYGRVGAVELEFDEAQRRYGPVGSASLREVPA